MGTGPSSRALGFIFVLIHINLCPIVWGYVFYGNKKSSISENHYRSNLQPTIISKRRTLLHAEDDVDNSEEDRTPKSKKRRSKFDRIVDDFVQKKYGAGEAFYGRRTADMSDEEFDKTNKIVTVVEDELENAPLKGNAILLVGDPETDITQWIVFELLEKGFSVRIACSSLKSGVKAFGKPGNNVDFCLINPSSSEKSIARCIESVQAIIITSNFLPTLKPFSNGQQKLTEGFLTAKRVLDLATQAQQANVGDVAKIVYLSRYVAPDTYDNVPEASVLDTFSAYFFAQSEISVLKFRDFCEKHFDFENIVRNTGFDYAIVRAPPVLYPLKAGAKDDMFIHPATIGIVTSKTSSPTPSAVKGSGYMAELDFAEAVVNSLLLEQVSQVTFAISGRPPAPNNRYNVKLPRIPRNAYYEILALDAATDVTNSENKSTEEERNVFYSEIKANYAMRNMDTFKSQLEEDAAVEEYWRTLLKDLPKDIKVYS